MILIIAIYRYMMRVTGRRRAPAAWCWLFPVQDDGGTKTRRIPRARGGEKRVHVRCSYAAVPC